jgi:hypothetical protein
MAEEFSPNAVSYHPVIAAGANASMPDALLSPWTSTSVMHCTDCHGNSRVGPDDPRGPHASANAHLLKKSYTAPGITQPSGDLCFDCHDLYTYTAQGSSSGLTSNFRRNTNNLHISRSEHRNTGCGVCHEVHASGRAHLISLYDAATNPEGELTSYTESSPGNYQKNNCSTRTTACH